MAQALGATGLILAGGRGRRMGGADKSFLTLAGRPLISHVIARARPQVGRLIINANADHARFAEFALPVVSDCVPGYLGPLAGVLAGLAWCKQNTPEAKWLATFPNDSPFFPDDLVKRLIRAAQDSGALIASAVSRGQHHPVFAVWSAALDASAEEIFVRRQVRRVDAGQALFANVRVDFTVPGRDPFFNINTPEDLAAAEKLLAR
jgi:molybdopterin-guanine dinucleotide biosynthesis protein A